MHRCVAQVRKARALLANPEPTALPTAEEMELAVGGGRASGEADASVVAPPPPAAAGAAGLPRWRRGLLLLIDTFSVDRKGACARGDGSYLAQWVAAIESEGFTFVRHRTLARSHALAFVTAPMGEAEGEAVHAREPPALLMRREERGPWR